MSFVKLHVKNVSEIPVSFCGYNAALGHFFHTCGVLPKPSVIKDVENRVKVIGSG